MNPKINAKLEKIRARIEGRARDLGEGKQLSPEEHEATVRMLGIVAGCSEALKRLALDLEKADTKFSDAYDAMSERGQAIVAEGVELGPLAQDLRDASADLADAIRQLKNLLP